MDGMDDFDLEFGDLVADFFGGSSGSGASGDLGIGEAVNSGLGHNSIEMGTVTYNPATTDSGVSWGTNDNFDDEFGDLVEEFFGGVGTSDGSISMGLSSCSVDTDSLLLDGSSEVECEVSIESSVGGIDIDSESDASTENLDVFDSDDLGLGSTHLISGDTENSERLQVGESSKSLECNDKSSDEYTQTMDTTKSSNNPTFLSRVFEYIVRRRKEAVKLGFTCLMVIYGVLIIAVAGSSVLPDDKQWGKVTGTVDDWVMAFTSGDFVTCDSMAYSMGDTVLGEDLGLLGSYEKSVDMYKALLMKGVSLIDKVSVDGSGNISVAIKQIKLSDEVSLDDEALATLISKYKEEVLNQEEFKSELEQIYFDAFEKTVLTEASENISVVRVGLEEVNGRVTHTYSFIRVLLQETGIVSNMRFFEDEIQSELSYYMSASMDIGGL